MSESHPISERSSRHILAVVNVQTSTIARDSDVVLPTLAGPEIGVASTKAFTCQLAALACLAIAAGRIRGVLSETQERSLVQALIEVPRLMIEALSLEAQIERLARRLAKSRDVLYLGRGTSYPLALEGALKLKEISYIHAEGYAGGELDRMRGPGSSLPRCEALAKRCKVSTKDLTDHRGSSVS